MDIPPKEARARSVMTGSMRGLPAIVSGVLATLLLAGCAFVSSEPDGDVVEGVDLDALFAPAARAEIEAVERDWAQRNHDVGEFGIVRQQEVTVGDWTGTLRILWHKMGGVVHYGAVIAPSGDAETRPVLVYLHGSDDGVSVEEVLTVYAIAPKIRDNFVTVIPSFRDEALSFEGQDYRSGGPASPLDRDVDDAIALVNVAVATTPSADAERIAALGFSRGAAVGLLMGIRDPRIDGVVDFFGPTDLLGGYARELFRGALRGALPELAALGYLNETIVQPLKNGVIGNGEVRLELIRRSPVYFADRLPAVQIHHGLADLVVPWEQGDALDDALRLARGDVETYFYMNGQHHPLTLTGSVERTLDFLMRIAGLPT